jgi:NCS1 family nucleobase:cation symporter-1
VLITDYWLLRRQTLSLPDLYDPDGEYKYTRGINWRAMAALAISIAPVVPGFIRAATTPGGRVVSPTAWDTLYTYAWFVTFGLSMLVYIVLMRSTGTRHKRPDRRPT